MRLLIDSHTLVWAILNDHRLSRTAKRIFGESRNHELHFSIVSLWELSLKITKGKLRTVGSSIDYLHDTIGEYGIQLLPLRYNHILCAESLEPHHGDPFDRMLIAQAIEENLRVVTDDAHFRHYPVKVVW
jgi:PIN domain nuclease of toxin-antitoxin system